MPNHRPQHIAKLLQEELNLLVGAELSDPRLDDAMVNVTRVVMSPDLRNARVYVEHALPPEGSRQVLAALAHAESFLREALIENVSLRYVPHLNFYVDNTEQRGRRIDEILDVIEHTDPEGDHAEPKPE
jgi:ribosome-binding factor A